MSLTVPQVEQMATTVSDYRYAQEVAAAIDRMPADGRLLLGVPQGLLPTATFAINKAAAEALSVLWVSELELQLQTLGVAT